MERGVAKPGTLRRLAETRCGHEICPILGEDGHFMYFNYGHLRRSYVRDHATYIDQIFIPAPGH